jgi:hypothetical protein
MMLQKIGMRVDDLAATGKAMALSELNLKYFAPLRILLHSETIVVPVRYASFHINQLTLTICSHWLKFWEISYFSNLFPG